MKKIIIMDTSILCCYLKIPGKDSCGKTDDIWGYDRVNEYIESAISEKIKIVLPLATIIETGNHIVQITGNVFSIAEKLSEIIIKAADDESPWTTFVEPGILWTTDAIRKLAEEWPELAKQKISMGDATIKNVADFYANAGYGVDILTGDSGLKSLEPATKQYTSRRKK